MSRKNGDDEFAAVRGEHVVRGSRRAYGLGVPLGPTQIGPAPPDVRQVISTYDSRPIGGYDFCLSGSFSTYASAAVASVQTPQGYVAVVRRIEVESRPGLVLPQDAEWIFFNNGVVMSSWTWAMGNVLTERSVDVFFPVQANSPMSLQATTGFSGVTTSAIVYVRFIGNLILDTSIPATQQVASLPASVRVVSSVENQR